MNNMKGVVCRSANGDCDLAEVICKSEFGNKRILKCDRFLDMQWKQFDMSD